MTLASILILAKNEEANIGRCLDAVFAQRGPSYEVVLVDSGSRDRTLEIAAQYPIARTERIPPEEFHHARTRNFAATLATSELLVYLACDAFPVKETWLAAMLAPFAEDPKVGAVYGRHLPKPGSQLERLHALGTLYGPERIVKDASMRSTLGYRYYLFSTVNAAIRREVWSATRFPEESRVFEDIGIAKRILDAGHKIVYEPGATVYHSHDYGSAMLFRRYFDIGVVLGRLGAWDSGSTAKSTMRRDGLRILRSKARAALNGGGLVTAGRAILYDAVKYAGMLLGRNERRLPRVLKRRFSQFRLFD
jgi:rhamnosyltransferase